MSRAPPPAPADRPRLLLCVVPAVGQRSRKWAGPLTPLVSCRITYCHLPFQSKWLYVGSERGNIHIVNVESFSLSGYVIMWNKAIEL